MAIKQTTKGYEITQNNQTVCTFENYEDAKRALEFLREKARA